MLEQATLEVRELSKRYPGVVALQDVDLDLRAGRIHALLGENGAGKSTLIKAITGVHRGDTGEIRLNGQKLSLRNVHDGILAGIGAVHQERNLVPRFTVAENIFLERLSGGHSVVVDTRKDRERALHWLIKLALDIDPQTRVNKLTVAQMQMVEIARALSLNSKVLLLDEPTASLASSETRALFTALKALASEGTAILYVSHKLEEVQEICDEVTILRDGRNACRSVATSELTRADIVALMVGRSEQASHFSPRNVAAPWALELRGVSTELGHRDVDLRVKRGELLGIYGLVGAGRSELARCIIGDRRITSGTLHINGERQTIHSVHEAVHRHGLGYVSEDRKGQGLLLDHSVTQNVGIPIWNSVRRFMGTLLDRRIGAFCIPFLEKLELRAASMSQTVGSLSGGNQQKISVAKWLAADVSILIVDEPTVGIDVRTKGYLHRMLRELAETGTTIILISSDLPEMIGLADRVVVMHNLQIVGELENSMDYDRMAPAVMNLIHSQSASLTS